MHRPISDYIQQLQETDTHSPGEIRTHNPNKRAAADPRLRPRGQWGRLLRYIYIFFFFWRNSPQWARASSFTRFLDHTQRRSTVGRTPLDEWSARRRDLYLTTHNTHKRQTSMPSAGFEPTIPASEWPQTQALVSAATGTGYYDIRKAN